MIAEFGLAALWLAAALAALQLIAAYALGVAATLALVAWSWWTMRAAERRRGAARAR
jgi:hypothetical protein